MGGGGGYPPTKKSQFFVAVFRKSVRVNIMILAYSNSKKVEFQLLNISWYINLYFERYCEVESRDLFTRR